MRGSNKKTVDWTVHTETKTFNEYEVRYLLKSGLVGTPSLKARKVRQMPVAPEALSYDQLATHSLRVWSVSDSTTKSAGKWVPRKVGTPTSRMPAA